MQKIIDGHLYDTGLAKEVAEISTWLNPNKSPTGGRCRVTETLYREIALKPGVSLSEARVKTNWGGYAWDDDKVDRGSGAFFLVVGFGWGGGDDVAVHPMTEEQARRWFERYHGSDVETYRRMFGAPSVSLPGYWEETGRERELRERERELEKLRDELEKLRDELAAPKEDAEARPSEIPGRTLTLAHENEAGTEGPF